MFSSDCEELFYKRLIQLRTQMGVSAREMSLSLGQSENYINNIESRKNFPHMLGFFYICEYLHITPAEFFDQTVDNPVFFNGLVKKLQKLGPKQLAHLEAIVDDILRQ